MKNDKILLNCNNFTHTHVHTHTHTHKHTHTHTHCLHKNFKLPCSNMKLNYTTPREIEKINKPLKFKNTLGYDGITMRILKVCTPFIASPLTYICNKSLSLGIFLCWLKFSEINPLYIKGDRTDINNFRPIPLLISFSKILEKVIYTRLYQHMKQNNILRTTNMASGIIQLKILP